MKSVAIIRPAVAFCLKCKGVSVTVYEASGKELKQIPCLNEHPLWISAHEKMARQFLA